MTTTLIRDLFEYNRWATGRILDALAAIPGEMYLREMNSSHGGLHGTMLHIVFAQEVWLLRWTGQPIDAAYMTSKRSTTLDSVRGEWERIEGETTAFFSKRLSDELLAGTLEMRNSKGDSFVHSYGDTMIHLVNHSSYHRGQIAALMRQLGFKPPGTDYIMYARERLNARG